MSDLYPKALVEISNVSQLSNRYAAKYALEHITN